MADDPVFGPSALAALERNAVDYMTAKSIQGIVRAIVNPESNGGSELLQLDVLPFSFITAVSVSGVRFMIHWQGSSQLSASHFEEEVRPELDRSIPLNRN